MIAVSVDIGYVALFVVLIVVPLLAIIAAVIDRMIVHHRQAPIHRPTPTGGFPVIAGPSKTAVSPSPPGSTYRIAGVIVATGEPVTLLIAANNSNQARVQAQLKGLFVINVEKQ